MVLDAHIILLDGTVKTVLVSDANKIRVDNIKIVMVLDACIILFNDTVKTGMVLGAWIILFVDAVRMS